MNTKAQVWTVDFIAGFMLFIIVLLVGLSIIFRAAPASADQGLSRDAEHLSTVLVSTGTPTNWTSTNVLVPGLLTSTSISRIDTRKLQDFSNISYSRTKTLLGIRADYVFFFKNTTSVINITQCNYGYPVATRADCTPILNTSDYKSLIKIERVVVYNSTPVMLVIYAWD